MGLIDGEIPMNFARKTFIRNIKRTRVARTAMILAAAVALGAASAPNALAAVHSGAHGSHLGGHAGHHGHARGPIMDYAPGLQSVDPLHGAAVAGSPSLAGKPRLGLRQLAEDAQRKL
jgi:hypothetical protein